MADQRYSSNLNITEAEVYRAMFEAKVFDQLRALGLNIDSEFLLDVPDSVNAMNLERGVQGTKPWYQAAANYTMQDTTQIAANIQSLSDKGDKRFSKEFLAEVIRVANKLNIPFSDLMVAMSFETGGTFSPSIRNKSSGATGLIQFMPSTARGLGTTTDALAGMTQVQQMKYVEKYLVNKRLSGRGFADIYMSILFPVAVGKPDSFVLFGTGAIKGFVHRAYLQNKGLDLNKDGSITKKEAADQAWLRGTRNLKG